MFAVYQRKEGEIDHPLKKPTEVSKRDKGRGRKGFSFW